MNRIMIHTFLLIIFTTLSVYVATIMAAKVNNERRATLQAQMNSQLKNTAVADYIKNNQLKNPVAIKNHLIWLESKNRMKRQKMMVWI